MNEDLKKSLCPESKIEEKNVLSKDPAEIFGGSGSDPRQPHLCSPLPETQSLMEQKVRRCLQCQPPGCDPARPWEGCMVRGSYYGQPWAPGNLVVNCAACNRIRAYNEANPFNDAAIDVGLVRKWTLRLDGTPARSDDLIYIFVRFCRDCLPVDFLPMLADPANRIGLMPHLAAVIARESLERWLRGA